MGSLPVQLTKSFLQTAKCRNATFIRSSPSAFYAPDILGRRWYSISPSSTSATTEVVETQTSTTEQAPAMTKPRRGPGRPRKDAPVLEAVEEVPRRKPGRPRKNPVPEATENSENPVELDANGEPIKKRRQTKRKPSQAPRPKKVTPTALTHAFQLELPPADTWHHYFPYKKDWVHRTTISNIETAKQLAELFVPEGSKDKIVIEVNAGPGQLSRALLALPKERIKKLIVLDDAETFKPTLKALEEIDPRVMFIPKAGKQWSTYADMEANGIFDDVKTLPWEQEHDQLQFIMQIPTDTHGEQLVAQLMRAVPDRQWLFKYGRMPMNFVLTTRMWERISAPTDTAARCKVSAMAEAVASFHEVLPPMVPHWDHFYPTRFGQPQTIQMTAASITPKAEQIIASGDLDIWDYCLRKLFVLRATPLAGVISTLGPGANNLLVKLNNDELPEEERVDIGKNPRQLDMHAWGKLVKAFKEWPFRPTDLSIETYTRGR